MKKIYILLFAALISVAAMGQYKRADRLFNSWEYFRAAKIYENKLTKHPNADAYYKLGQCYQKMNLYKEAQTAYDKVNAEGAYSNPEFYLNYGLILRNNGKDAQAKAAFEKFNKLMPKDPRGKLFSASIDIVADDHKYDEPITLKNVGMLNTVEADFCPVIYKDGIVFTSSRNAAGHGKTYGWTGSNYLNLYYAKKGSNNLDFTDVNIFGSKNISEKYHDGPACFSKNYDTIYISRVAKYLKGTEKKRLGIERNKIFISTIEDDKWTKVIPFEYNSDNYSVANPFLTADGSRLYFVSDMPGGFGETDIWYCDRKDSSWNTPINMGAKINTFNREKYPTIGPDGNFYFASNGYHGFGGLDICVSLNNNGTFEMAKPMKAPFNSSYDDYGVVFLKAGRIGYISSNRYKNGQGDTDILYFDLLQDKFDSTLTTSLYTIGYRPGEKTTIVPEVLFTVNSPENIPVKRVVKETFPLRNYIFFDLGSTKIPEKYVLITKNQVNEFSENQLDMFAPKNLPIRSKEQMKAYYNIINILGDRMVRNPNSKITLVGSSEKGIEDGKLMAESVKKYLCDVFEIKASRISIEGRSNPKIPSGNIANTINVELLRSEDRRVSIESASPALLMEFQERRDAPLKPVVIETIQEAPIDSYVTFNVVGGNEAFSSWSLEISDKNSNVQKLGPYTEESVSIPGKTILGTKAVGNFQVTMIGKTQDGTIVEKEVLVHMVLWTPATDEIGLRFSVIFEYNNSSSIKIYEKYLTEIVTPKIPKSATVIIHGHADIIGNKTHNMELSFARANNVRAIIEKTLANAGRNDVKFKVLGFGEDESVAPFENKLPEERFYNRTVIIDIVPQSK
jgi:outer membrane protein OmpA-like peptidoglycan-associated protein/tetratricopeptide (TPR) repeat protein